MILIPELEHLYIYCSLTNRSFDLSISSGKSIPIEQRDASEVAHFRGTNIAPRQVGVYNPAFDVTDHRLITALITEAGIIKPVDRKHIKSAFQREKKKPANR